MIQVLLLILKIIGITILAILGLILLILVLVLFVPVFYRVRVIHNPQKTEVKARASFLFPLLLVTFQYLKKISYKVRVFGFAVLDSDKPKKEKQPKEKKPKKAKKKKQKKQKPVAEPVLAEETEEPVTMPANTAAEQQELPPLNSGADPQPEEKEPRAATEDGSKKQGFFDKIKCKIQKTRETISNAAAKVKRLWHMKNEVQRILAKPETKEAISFAWDKLKRLLKHILPRKIKGYVAFGMDNPATTGQILGALSVVYAKTGKLLEICPNFTEKQLECDVELKGRIQVFTLLVIAIKVLLNQEIKQLINEFKGLKEIE